MRNCCCVNIINIKDNYIRLYVCIPFRFAFVELKSSPADDFDGDEEEVPNDVTDEVGGFRGPLGRRIRAFLGASEGFGGMVWVSFMC